MKKLAVIAVALATLAVAPLSAKKETVLPPASVGPSYVAVWQKGYALEAKAAANLAKAQGNLAKANTAIATATSKQTNAANSATVAAADFRSLTASTPANFATSAEAQAWAKKVAEAAKLWTDAEKRGAKGGKLQVKATKDKAAAEAAIVKAQAEIEQGRAIMASAQRP